MLIFPRQKVHICHFFPLFACLPRSRWWWPWGRDVRTELSRYEALGRAEGRAQVDLGSLDGDGVGSCTHLSSGAIVPWGFLLRWCRSAKFWDALWMLKCWTCFRIWFDTGCTLTVGYTLTVGCALTVNRKTYLDSWGTCHVPEGYPPTCIYLYNKKCVGKAVEQLDQGSLLHRFTKVLLITITMSMTTLTMMTMVMTTTSFMAYYFSNLVEKFCV